MTGAPLDPRFPRLLELVRAGDPSAREELLPLVYGELRSLAGKLMSREREGHTLQTTALVHEAWLRLGGAEEARAEDREHFLAIAARAMRNVLVDHARARQTHKRGGGRELLPLDEVVELVSSGPVDLLSLDELLERLAEQDEQLARIVELRYFAGLTVAEVAGVLGQTERQVSYGWSLARAWLQRELEREGSDG